MREWMVTGWLRVKALIRRRQLERDLEEELSFHLAMREEKALRAGAQSADAHKQVRRQFGNEILTKERCRDLWTFASFEILLQDLRYGARTLARNPGFTAAAVLSLGLGIAANSTIFSVLNAILFRALPYASPERLVLIWETRHKDQQQDIPPLANVMDWRSQNRSFEDIARAALYSGAETLTGLGPAERVQVH
ncbi:MAG: permease prefix domain 1-containing protein [Bryobacteraceae bacterium]